MSLPKKDEAILPAQDKLRSALEDQQKQGQDYRDRAEQPTYEFSLSTASAYVTSAGTYYFDESGTWLTTASYPLAVNTDAGREYAIDFTAGGILERVSGTPATSGANVLLNLGMVQGDESTTLRTIRLGMAKDSGIWYAPIAMRAVVTPKAGKPARFFFTAALSSTTIKFGMLGYYGFTATPRIVRAGKNNKR